MVRDVRLFVNTLQHAVDLMTAKGIPATTTCGRRDGCLEYVVRIPVESADTSLPLPGPAADKPAGKPAAEPAAPAAPTARTIPDPNAAPPAGDVPHADAGELAASLAGAELWSEALPQGEACHRPVMPPPAPMPAPRPAAPAPQPAPAQALPCAAPPADGDLATVASLTRQG